MSSIPESWFQDIAEELQLPALSPIIYKTVQSNVETEIKKLIEQSNKFRKHGKSAKLTVEHINYALSKNHIEEIHGLSNKIFMRNKDANDTSTLTIEATKIDLLELAKQPLPRCPLAPELNMHWLVIDNVQPKIPENPNIIIVESDSHPVDLPKEMQIFYSKTTGAILSLDKTMLPTVFQICETDTGLQELLPFYSRFIYRHIKNTTKSLPLLNCLVQFTKSLLMNPALHHEFHLHQLIPAILTCVVGANVSNSRSDDHWSLRFSAAQTIAIMVRRYRDTLTDLQPRICKTYIEAFAPDKSLESVYGAIVGLTLLGHSVVRNLLLPSIRIVTTRMEDHLNRLKKETKLSTNSNNDMDIDTKVEQQEEEEEEEIDYEIEKNKHKARENKSNIEVSTVQSKARYLEKFLEAEEVVKRCKFAMLIALGNFMQISIKIPNVLELDLAAFSNKKSDRARLKMLLTHEDSLVAELSESLIPYYVSISKQIDYCRMFI